MWLMLQQKQPEDFIIATGKSHTVREFVRAAAAALEMPVTFEGKGLTEVARDETGKVVLTVDKKFFRPSEVHFLKGDARKARRVLGWQPKVSFDELVSMMAKADRRLLQGNVKMSN